MFASFGEQYAKLEGEAPRRHVFADYTKWDDRQNKTKICVVR